jgi:hypothetical protein
MSIALPLRISTIPLDTPKVHCAPLTAIDKLPFQTAASAAPEHAFRL